MYSFEKCSYQKLQEIRQSEDLVLSGWTLLEEAYIDETKMIFNNNGVMVALINYYFDDKKKEKMCLALFEVFPQYRDKGIGKQIVAQFLKHYKGEINLLPSGEASESFWKQCGFESGCYLDLRE